MPYLPVWGGLMGEERSGKDRRVIKDRGKSSPSYNSGPEKRGIKYRRSGKDRRKDKK